MDNLLEPLWTVLISVIMHAKNSCVPIDVSKLKHMMVWSFPCANHEDVRDWRLEPHSFLTSALDEGLICTKPLGYLWINVFEERGQPYIPGSLTEFIKPLSTRLPFQDMMHFSTCFRQSIFSYTLQCCCHWEQ